MNLDITKENADFAPNVYVRQVWIAVYIILSLFTTTTTNSWEFTRTLETCYDTILMFLVVF